MQSINEEYTMEGRNERTITVVRYNQKSVVGRTVQYSAMWCGRYVLMRIKNDYVTGLILRICGSCRHILTPLLDSGLSTALDLSRHIASSARRRTITDHRMSR